MITKHPFTRVEKAVGSKALEMFADTRIAVFGVGGVGSWCAEALVRSGIGKLTIVDPDAVCVTNINRQLQATSVSVGKPKVEAMADRLREINPDAEIEALRRVYDFKSRGDFDLSGYDYVIDAIDSLSSKVDLIMNAVESGATLYSALGAACKADPTRVKVSSIWKSDRCKLGRFVRKRLRKWGFKGDFLCVWSDEPELRSNVSGVRINGDVDDVCMDQDDNAGDGMPTNKTINGSLVCVTGVFGFTLSALVVQDVIKKSVEV